MTQFVNNDVSSGAVVYASDHNTQGALLAAVLNGGLDNDNLAAGAAIAGSKLADDTITSAKIDWSTTGGIWGEQLGRFPLSVAGDTITVDNLPAKKYLRIMYFLLPTGQINPNIRFNNDSGNNYASRFSPNGGGADTTATSQSANFIDTGGGVTVPIYGFMDVINVATQEKLSFSTSIDVSTAGAANAPGRRLQWQKWANTTDQITRVDVRNGGTGDFAIGSEVIVLGHD